MNPPVWPAIFFSAVAATGSCIAAYLNLLVAKQNLRATKQLKQLDVFQKIVDRLENPESRAARREARRLRDSGMTAEQVIANENARKCVDQVCRDFDLIGLLDNADVIDRTLVDRFYAVPFIDLYDPFLKKYIDRLRLAEGENRGRTHFWEVDQLYDRVKNVVHPSKRTPSVWPEDPRSGG